MTAEQSNPAGVLVVEDDRDVADLYAKWLDRRYDTETAYSGADALEQLDESVDVVLLDRMMPGLSGGEVLEAVRDADIDPQVVIISAVTPDLDIVKMGLDAYLEKPVDATALHETVDQMLTRAEYDEKLQNLFSLIERQETLEAVKQTEVLEHSEEYRSLTDRLETVQREVESLLTELPDEDFRVAVERLQRTAAERTSERQYELLTEDVLDSSQEGTVVVGADGGVVWANEATERLLGFDRSDLRGREYASAATDYLQGRGIETEEESLASLIRAGLASNGAQLEATVHVPGDGVVTERWLEYRSAPIETGLYAGGRIEHYHDITGRYRREQYLQTLHSATRELMSAETDEQVTSHAVTTATRDLEFPYAAVFTRDQATGDLVPRASEITTAETGPALPTLSGGTDPVWRAFADRAERLSADTYRERNGYDGWLDDAFDDWMLCPLGQRGVFLVATTDGGSLSATKQTLAETWAANTRQALEQLARTRNLRDRDRELERQNKRLSRLDRINKLIRSIGPAVASADTRAEIETEVCRRLLRMEPVTGVWVADVDISTDGTVCRARTGNLEDYLANVPRATAEASGTGAVETTPGVPARQAYETRSSVSVTDLVAIQSDVWWRNRGLKRGTNTIVAVPVVHESTRFGAIELHLDRPAGMEDEELDALAELATTIGHAIGAIRQRDALLSGGGTFLTFQIDSDSRLSQLVTVADAPLTVTDISRQDDRTCAVFVTVEVGAGRDSDRIETRIENTPGVSVLRTGRTEITCVLTLGPESPTQQLAKQGAALQQLEQRPDPNHLVVTVELPHETEVREYVDAVTGALDGVELVAKRHQPADRRSASTVTTAVDDQLTDRQREALQTAFHAGYFDWPRSADADTVAAEIGIAQSTLSQHLRTAEQKLLAELFS
ncbi:MAG: PAS sensor histidine kinase [halophilic archaeon J07HX64]|jgi:PAS domain S-box|nr:MAG: PAS sensor histidine kinase [halophilic archaeon J07HX64]